MAPELGSMAAGDQHEISFLGASVAHDKTVSKPTTWWKPLNLRTLWEEPMSVSGFSTR